MPDDDLPFGRIIIANPQMRDEIQRAIANGDFPSAAGGNGGDLFPRQTTEGECRICGKRGKLTREHTPPRAAFNSERTRGSDLLDWLGTDDLDVLDWLGTDDLDVPPSGPHLQGGVWGYSLCVGCNAASGRYVPEYGVWARGAAQVMIEVAESHAPEDINDLDAWCSVNIRLVDVFPARFVRQALAQAFVASGTSELAGRYPVLRELVLGGDPAALPVGTALFLTLYGGPNARYAGGPHGQPIYREGLGWTHAIEVAYPPFAIQLILDGSTDAAAGIDLSEFTERDVEEEMSFNLEEMMIGFGNTPFPLDYRPKGMILSAAGESESER